MLTSFDDIKTKLEKYQNIQYCDYDIIYSLTVHEAIDCLFELILNILFFNKSIKCGIILHCNEFMYNELKKHKLPQCVFVNPHYYPKQRHTYSILKAHLDNFNYLSAQFEYFCLLASNCMFLKEVTMDYIKNINNSTTSIFCDTKQQMIDNNPLLKQFMINNEIANNANWHEGALFSRDNFKQIYDYINDNNIEKLIVTNITAEEIILASIEIKLFNYCHPRICYVGTCSLYSNKKHRLIPKNMVIYKKVHRQLNHRSRTSFRELWYNQL